MKAFEGLVLVQELFLTRNKFDGIPNPSTVGSLLSLQYLDMYGNSIKTISRFEGYEALTYLNLRNNQIRVVHGGDFNFLRRLNVLNLQQNQIARIDKLAFEELTKLTSLITPISKFIIANP